MSARLLPDIFFDTRPSLILKIIWYRVTWNIGYFPLFQVIPNILGLPEIPEINTRLSSIPDPNPPAIAKTSSSTFVVRNINTLFISKCDSGHPPASQQLCWGWACRLEEFSGFDLFREGLFQSFWSFCPLKQGCFNILQYWKVCGSVYIVLNNCATSNSSWYCCHGQQGCLHLKSGIAFNKEGKGGGASYEDWKLRTSETIVEA